MLDSDRQGRPLSHNSAIVIHYIQLALTQTGYKCPVVTGGVSANILLRTRLGQIAKKEAVRLYFPRPEFCTDNGAMIAYAGAQRLTAGQSEGLAFGAWPRWKLDELPGL